MIRHLIFGLMILGGINAQDRCTTPQNKSGFCIGIHGCKPIVDIFQTQRPLTKEFLQYIDSLQCGFEGTIPKVCCEQQTTVTPAPTTERPNMLPTIPEPPNVAEHPNLSLLNHDVCGPVTQQKIFGGNKTGVFDFPWMALLVYNTGKRFPEYLCGGSLINQRYVLTAAHCVTTLASNLELIGVRLGEHDLSTERDCDKDADGLDVVCAERYQDFGIERVHYHPDFSRARLINDIALIRLNGNADLRPQSVRPICLPIGDAANLTRKKVIATGWGATELGVRSQDLLQVQLSVVELEECKNQFKNRAHIWYKQICAGGKRGMDSCSGDSGGPLQAPGVYNNNLRYIQYGLVSFGLQPCGTEGSAGVYTKITYYMDWILNTLTA